jgi:hypothetical protein
MNHGDKPTKRISEGFASILILISICIVSNFLSVLVQRGAFKFWRSLPSLASPATQIVNADPFSVWVQTADNQIFAARTTCSKLDVCYQWLLVQDANEIFPVQVASTVRKADCEDFDGQFPRNPSGKVIECIKTYQPGVPEGGGFTTYYALISDGTLKYWQLSEGSFLTPFFCLAIPSLVCPPIGLLIMRGLYARYSKIQRKAG